MFSSLVLCGVVRFVPFSCAISNVKKVSLELGGKSPLIIFADCDLNKAVQMVKVGPWDGVEGWMGTNGGIWTAKGSKDGGDGRTFL